ncbi:MAG: hypothetical protein AB9903_22255 [Vulcanimicrobiota bacterium]
MIDFECDDGNWEVSRESACETPVYMKLQYNWGVEQVFFLTAPEAELPGGMSFVKEVLEKEKTIRCTEFDIGALNPVDIKQYIYFLDGALPVDALADSPTAALFGSYVMVDENEEPYNGTGTCFSKWMPPDWWNEKPAAIFWKGLGAGSDHLRLVRRLIGMTITGGFMQRLPSGISMIFVSSEGKAIMENITRMTGYGLLPLQWLEPPFERYGGK